MANEEAAAYLKGKFLTSFGKWVESEVRRQAADLMQVKAVGMTRFGPDKLAASIAQSQEASLAADLGVT